MIRPKVWLSVLLAFNLAACQTANVAGTDLPVFTYRPSGCNLRVVLLVFHGESRQASYTRDSAESLADRVCGFVVAPEFNEWRFPVGLYQFGGVAGEPPGHRTIDLVPPLVAWARHAAGAPGLPFVLLGHSAGGQFLSRVAAFVPTGAAGIIIANPSTWVLPSTTIAAPFGLGATESATDDALRAYLAQPVTVLLGTADRGFGELVEGPEAVAQGPDRYTRGINTFGMAEAVARSRGWQFGWTLAEVPGAGHHEAAMYSSPQAVAAVQRALSSVTGKP
jgi:poly(3-hydroxybutyrate) depolymerase